jgi:predicted nucleic acid-binding protein
VAKIILDTGPLVALLDKREDFHHWTIAQLPELRGPLVTCEAVLTEAFFLISAEPNPNRQLHTLLQNGVIIGDFSFPRQLLRVLHLMQTYRKVPMSLADACLVCMVENNPASTLFTLDRDFTVYRQQRRRLIPLLAPF